VGGNGTVVHYCFFNGGSHFSFPSSVHDAVRGALPNGRRLEAASSFQEVNTISEAEFRIGYSTATELSLGRSADNPVEGP